MSCDHQNFLEIEKSWRINKPLGFWQSGIGDKSETFSFSFLPQIEFYISLEAHQLYTNWTYFKITADCELDPSDFVCYLWAENDDCEFLREWKHNQEVDSSEDREISINQRIFLYHECKPMEIHCRIQYTNDCPQCLKEQALIDDAINNVKEEEQQVRNELNKTISKLKDKVARLEQQTTNKRKRKFTGDPETKENNSETEIKKRKTEHKECDVKLKKALKERDEWRLKAQKLQERLLATI
ncbi:hypothetical protein M3Y96_00441200 [Aphelenchoides besseyi]|nr:hypothetical protein M3Y96_00441200 [Aphelenchoides besseyi]